MASLAEFEGRVIYERLSKGKRRKAWRVATSAAGFPTGTGGENATRLADAVEKQAAAVTGLTDLLKPKKEEESSE